MDPSTTLVLKIINPILHIAIAQNSKVMKFRVVFTGEILVFDV